MKGRFGTPLWVIPVLAMVMALGAFAVFASINQFSANPAEASIQEAGQGLSSNVDLEKITKPFQNPVTSATAVTTGTNVINNPLKPGAAATFTFKFTPTTDIATASDIVLKWPKEFLVPETINRNEVTIASTLNGGSGCPTGGQIATDTVSPTEVSVDFIGPDREPEITLVVPDMNGGDNCSGNQSLGATGVVTLIFRQSAGIRNAAEADENYEIALTTPAGNATYLIDVPWQVDLSSPDGSRGSTLTVVGLGFKDGRTVTFWRDANGDGVRQNSEAGPTGLCQAVSGDDFIATCSFTVSNPPFKPRFAQTTVDSGTDLNGALGATAGAGQTVTVDSSAGFVVGQTIRVDSEDMTITAIPTGTTLTVTRPAGAATHADNSDVFILGSCTVNLIRGCNFINGVDSRSNTTDLSLFANAQNRLDLQVFDLRGQVTAQPNTGKPGDTLTIQLRDFPASQAITSIDLSGTAVALSSTSPASPSTDANGSANFSMDIPTGTTQGRLELQIRSNPAGGVDSLTRRTTITVGGANLTLSHDMVIPNQDLTISGDGFTQSTSEVCIAEGGITLADVPLQIDDTGDCSTNVLNNAPADAATGTTPERGIKLSSGGTFTVTVRVEQTDATVPAALATPGSHELKVRDTSGAEGTLTVTIPERTIEVTPASARPRDVVTVIGRQFIADNPDGRGSSVRITYDGGSGCTRQATADPDVSGNFRETLRIPSGCAIPSTNTIRAEILADSTVVDTETVTHEIPQAFVSVDPVRGSSGNEVSVSGEGFRTFTAVDDIKFGNLSALGNRSVNTDASGNFSIDGLIVPGLDPGIHAVRVDVGTASDPNRVTATTSFEVLESGFAGAQSFDAVDVFGGMSTLERAWLFDNTDKEWQFFDTRDEFIDVNSLLEVPSGAPLWLKVTEDTEVELNGQSFNLTCVSPGTPEEDCWNLIVFP